MDFRVGASPDVGSPAEPDSATRGQVEARVLSVRPPRGTSGPPPGVERRQRPRGGPDPRGGCVLVLMIPDGHRLPRNLSAYRVFLRFRKR